MCSLYCGSSQRAKSEFGSESRDSLVQSTIGRIHSSASDLLRELCREERDEGGGLKCGRLGKAGKRQGGEGTTRRETRARDVPGQDAAGGAEREGTRGNLAGRPRDALNTERGGRIWAERAIGGLREYGAKERGLGRRNAGETLLHESGRKKDKRRLYPHHQTVGLSQCPSPLLT